MDSATSILVVGLPGVGKTPAPAGSSSSSPPCA